MRFSSGSGAAVAAALAQVTIGTETDGSIVCPSGAMGLVGLKPTLGLVSRAGIIPISAQQDTAGPMARHVVDAAITMNVIQGEDPQDPATCAIPPDQPRVYRLDGRALDGARIGVWRMAGIDPDVDAIVERSVQAMRAAGATVVEVTLDESAVFNDEVTAIFSEFKRDIAKYLRVTPGRHPATLAELIAFNQADPIELRFFGQDRFELAERAPLASDPVVVAARQRATSRARAIIDEALAVYDLDAIVAPTNGPAWLTTLGQGDAVTGPSSSRLPAVSGYPSITVPAGLDGELPIGVSFDRYPLRRRRPAVAGVQLRARGARPAGAEAAGVDRRPTRRTGSLTGSTSPTWRAQDGEGYRPAAAFAAEVTATEEGAAMTVVSVHIADVGLPKSLGFIRHPRPASIPGLLHANAGRGRQVRHDSCAAFARARRPHRVLAGRGRPQAVRGDASARRHTRWRAGRARPAAAHPRRVARHR